jgi:hypothetical protein
MLCKLWYPPSSIIGITSLDERASQVSKQTYSARDESKDVSRSRSQRKKLAQGATIGIIGVTHQYQQSRRDTPFHLVYEADVLPPEIYHESAQVAQFNEEEQAETRELESNLLEEMCNKALTNI